MTFKTKPMPELHTSWLLGSCGNFFVDNIIDRTSDVRLGSPYILKKNSNIGTVLSTCWRRTPTWAKKDSTNALVTCLMIAGKSSILEKILSWAGKLQNELVRQADNMGGGIKKTLTSKGSSGLFKNQFTLSNTLRGQLPLGWWPPQAGEQ